LKKSDYKIDGLVKNPEKPQNGHWAMPSSQVFFAEFKEEGFSHLHQKYGATVAQDAEVVCFGVEWLDTHDEDGSPAKFPAEGQDHRPRPSPYRQGRGKGLCDWPIM
jgi:hypothetical protein